MLTVQLKAQLKFHKCVQEPKVRNKISQLQLPAQTNSNICLLERARTITMVVSGIANKR